MPNVAPEAAVVARAMHTAIDMVPPREPLNADRPQQKAAAVLWRVKRTQRRPRMPHL